MGGRGFDVFTRFQEKLKKLSKKAKCQAEIRVCRRENLGVHAFCGKPGKVLFSG